MGNYDFQNGVNHGEQDITSGRGDCARTRYLKRRFKWDQFLPGADNRYEGYTNGYRFSQNNALTTINTKSVNGGGGHQQSLYSQGLWCYQTIKNLIKLTEQIKDSARKYHKGVEDLKSEKYLGELRMKLVEEKNEFIKKCDALIKSIENEQIPYIEQRLEKIEDLLDKISK